MQPRRPAAPPDPALSAALAGAVDLSAVKARAEARERAEQQAAQAAQQPGSADGAAAPPPPAAPAAVLDVTEATFQAEVLDRSFTVPVVLDLWAEWCGPCKQLSPVLERLARESGGSWVLAKIDVDANQAIAQALRVQGIPAVKAVWQGQLVGEFTGAVPEPQVRQFVSALLEATGGEAAAAAGPDGGPPDGELTGELTTEPEDPRLTAADEAVARGDLDDAGRRYREILADEPAHPYAGAALRQVELLRRLQQVPADAVARADAAPDDVAAQLAAADVQVAEDRAAEAFDRLVGAVRRTSGADRDTARARLVELFSVVGDDDPRVAVARRRLASALF